MLLLKQKNILAKLLFRPLWYDEGSKFFGQTPVWPLVLIEGFRRAYLEEELCFPSGFPFDFSSAERPALYFELLHSLELQSNTLFCLALTALAVVGQLS